MNLRQLFLIASFALASVSLSSLAHASFTDVKETSPYFTALTYLEGQGIVKGYSDKTFKPDNLLNKAEFVHLVLQSTGSGSTLEVSLDTKCFSDVASQAWYYQSVCQGKKLGLISGTNGAFSPERQVTVVEAAKMIALAFHKDEIVESSVAWYEQYLKVLDTHKYLPTTLNFLSQPLTRGEAALILYRALTQDAPENFRVRKDLKAGTCVIGSKPKTVIPHVDMAKVRSSWLSWNNDLRKQLGRNAYAYNPSLDMTALEWSVTSAKRGYIDHKKYGSKKYYDYKLLTKWFADRGVTFTNVNRVTNTENIGWGYYSCNDSDCTDELIKSIRTTYMFFYNEKGKKYRPHYESLIKKEFNYIGLGIALNPAQKRYYLTVHYGTQVKGKTAPYCNGEE